MYSKILTVRYFGQKNFQNFQKCQKTRKWKQRESFCFHPFLVNPRTNGWAPYFTGNLRTEPGAGSRTDLDPEPAEPDTEPEPAEVLYGRHAPQYAEKTDSSHVISREFYH